MEETELMIGDWMDWPKSPFANPHFYSQVVALEKGGISPCIGIPLTPEILEKNGCTMIDKGDYGEWHIKENPNIPLWQHTEFIIFGGIEIHFVHQFQHALRLCGLKELADNFKI